jgi:predicted metalloenzyme YecM
MTNHTNQISWVALQGNIEPFTRKLFSALTELGILEQCQKLSIDHICVRLEDVASVDHLKQQLVKVGQIISSIPVNGREIIIFQLSQALDLGPWHTYGVELPYPKSSHSYADGWEHVEFVLAGAENTMNGVRQAFKKTFLKLDKDQLAAEYAYREDEPQAAGDQTPNPTISLKVNGIGLKFHARPIQAVVGFQA